MAKYEYVNGERRHYRGVAIWYDLEGAYEIGYYDKRHWYVRTCTSLQDTGDCKSGNSPRKSKVRRHYFSTLADAKRFIDEF